MTESQFERCARLVRRSSGLRVDSSNRRVFERRFLVRARASGCSVEGYLRTLSAKESELERLVASLSFGTTRFYRNSCQLRALADVICPMLQAAGQRGERPIKVWSAGCSTGEEAYTLAIVLRDCLPANRSFEVIGTDLNAESLDVARKGWYESATSLPAQYAGRYLLPWRQGYLVSEEIRSHVTFHRHNLVFSGAPRGIDIVSCRNVLYYLNESERFRAVRALWEAMNPLSFLVIGNSETLAGWSSLFKRLSMRGATIYRRQGVSDSAPPAGDADFRAS